MTAHVTQDNYLTNVPPDCCSALPTVSSIAQDVKYPARDDEAQANSLDQKDVDDINDTGKNGPNCLFRELAETNCIMAKTVETLHSKMIKLEKGTSSFYSTSELWKDQQNEDGCLPHVQINYPQTHGDVREPSSLLYSSCLHRDNSCGESSQQNNGRTEKLSTAFFSPTMCKDGQSPRTQRGFSYSDRVLYEELDDDLNAADADFDISLIKKRQSKSSYCGIPLLVKKLNKLPPALSEVCLGCAEEHIAAAAKERPLTIGITRKGNLRVTVETTIAASLLQLSFIPLSQDVDSLGDLPVKVVLPSAYSDNMAKISKVPLVYTDAQIREFFAASGVVAAKRQVHYRLRKEDGALEVVPRDTVVLTFRPERTIPLRIRPSEKHAEALDYSSFRVTPHVSPPAQCYNCYRFGHMVKHCRRRTRCKVCAAYHSYKQCSAKREQLKCCNCKGPHAATYCGCPVRLAAVRDKSDAIKYDHSPRMVTDTEK